MRYRPFRNFDPPALVAVWNESMTCRGAIEMRSSALFETIILDKPYFDPHGLIIAETDEGQIAGFVQAGFGPADDFSSIQKSQGVVCMIVVRPAFQRQGVGAALLARAETYLRQQGAATIQAGSQRPAKPFFLGLYGGSNAPGFLESDTAIHPFLKKHGYVPHQKINVFDRRVDVPLNIVDPRFAPLRKKYETQVIPQARLGSWWRESVIGPLEPSEFRLDDKQSGNTVAKALFWEMKDYGWRWGAPAAGVIDVQVRTEFRRLGIGKHMVAQLLRHLAEQYFGIVEVQIPEKEAEAMRMFRALGFNQVDTGVSYLKT
ncbi:GNAT family N-acetyltransferase [Zavarzinella formosa]|uniref:GNAT family N-acetyltransferase n=1 Tax=Zavarzinella formosa TaxID=360055 RepID=UPI001EE67B40|nr:GNAT family N-acetyltransferase [Zavarzinella formosa]